MSIILGHNLDYNVKILPVTLINKRFVATQIIPSFKEFRDNKLAKFSIEEKNGKSHDNIFSYSENIQPHSNIFRTELLTFYPATREVSK